MAPRIPPRWLIKAHGVLACGALLCVSGIDDAAARPHGPGRLQRQGFAHLAQGDARAARQAERAFQRGGQGRGGRGAPRELPMQPQPPAPAPPVYQPPQPPPQARPGRLTPDERRALRQQINEAGRDVYQPR